MPNNNRSDELITPISKSFVLRGNFFIVFFIVVVLIPIFFIPTTKKIPLDIFMICSKDKCIMAYCIMPEELYNKVDLTTIYFDILKHEQYSIKMYSTKRIEYDKLRKEYLIEFDVSINYSTDINSLLIIKGVLDSKKTTWGQLIFKMDKS